ncbi:translation initiation factor IF-2 [candidate division WOR-3 bacterium]|nr:translation initiation factor IF-2 [candidate division WOR-3 bacterium]
MTKKEEGKIRIYELAKELDVTNDEILDFLKKEGIKVKSVLSSITKNEADKAKKGLQGKTKKKSSAKPKKAPKTKKEKKVKDEKRKKKTTRKKKAPKEIKPKKLKKEEAKKKPEEKKEITKEKHNLIEVGKTNSIKELSKKMSISASEIINACLKLGIQATINQNLDFDTTHLIAEEFGFKVKLHEPIEVPKIRRETYKLQKKSPVVTIMGHVDHGKTTLLDYIRKTQVAKQESGGITQKIGAYHINYNSHKITFIDTPGHEAFTSMRARGANVTDIVVLVVAANEGVKSQTIEAINHAKAANAPIIVAINKIDLSSANPSKVLADLAEKEVVAHEYGGNVIAVRISALKGEGIDELLDAIILQSEDLNLRAPLEGPGIGIILETRIKKGIGNVATVVVKEGEIKIGDSFVAGSTSGKVRLILDENDKRLKTAGVSQAVQISQFESLPKTGDIFKVVKNTKTARDISEERKSFKEEKKEKETISLSNLYEKIKEDEKEFLKLVIKGDDAGSVDALKILIESLPKEKIQIKVIHSSIGPINENDVMLAQASEGIIIGFKVKPYPQAKEEAKKRGVEIKTYDVIFEITEDIKKAMLGLLKPEKEEVKCGEIEIRKIFEGSTIGKVAGCFVLSGAVNNNDIAYLFRDNKEIIKTKIATLKRFDKDVKSVEEGYECGIRLTDFDSFKEGDIIESYKVIEKERKL